MTDEEPFMDRMLPCWRGVPEERTRLRLRLLSPMGRYPDVDVRSECALLIVREDIAFSAVIVRPMAAHGMSEEHHSEIEIFALEEMQFYARVSLSVHPEKGMIYVYPLEHYIDLSLTCDGVEKSVRWNTEELLANARAQANEIKGPLHCLDGQNFIGALRFIRHREPFDAHLFGRLLAGADAADWLTMCGLGALFRGDMVWLHREFAEFGVMAMHVAMEASFHVIRERLKREGNPDPSAFDAGAWLDAVFNPHIETGAYFADWYADRIKIAHPSSRFGTYPYPPLAADDFHDLRSALHLVYVYLLTGENVMAGDDKP